MNTHFSCSATRHADKQSSLQCWSLTVLGFLFIMHSHGLGIHADVVYPGNTEYTLKWLVISEVFYAWGLAWIKISGLLMYHRISHVAYFKHTTLALGLVVLAWAICITFVFIFTCVPVEKLWNPRLQGHCINQIGTWVANAASTIITDVIILLLPIYQIRKLQLKLQDKIGLYLIFSVGFLYGSLICLLHRDLLMPRVASSLPPHTASRFYYYMTTPIPPTHLVPQQVGQPLRCPPPLSRSICHPSFHFWHSRAAGCATNCQQVQRAPMQIPARGLYPGPNRPKSPDGITREQEGKIAILFTSFTKI
jgi:hypothetical protein